MLYMLDTNAASEAIRGHKQLDNRLQTLTLQQWCISAVTYSELRYGLARRPEATQLARIVGEFLRIATVVPWDRAAADRHATLRAHLRAEGTPIGDFDEMIGAHALAKDAILVTDNIRHFQRVPGLHLENWLRDSLQT
jgi:tRNA(fMet)-specific endonuclease VapC